MTAQSVREQQSRVTASLDGVQLGVFEDRTGGETGSNSVQYFMGGGGPRVSLGGQQQVGDVTLTVLSTPTVQSITKWVISRVGKGDITISDQPLDDEGNAFGDPLTWNGILMTATPPATGASSNNPKTLILVAQVSGSMA
jgi:hypothetical protein